ncbi:MAG TPA: alanine racemase [Candidatus Cloacimonadota bacterium]|nr:alanine racemase [Candidatus Cloacimonadota bacterium]HQL14157.1 alanine racemase [Candidatus Cloacimonadota bacterium]
MMSERSRVDISLDNYRNNVKELKRFLLPHQNWLQIVKADAYGHGAYEIAKIALEEGAVYLGVANPEEGKLLRIQGIKAPILILSPALKEEIPVILQSNLACTISDLNFAQALNQAAQKENIKAVVHVKIDTGMHRSGFRTEEFPAAWENIKKMKSLEVEGVFSHFAASEQDYEFSEKQVKQFERLLKKISPLPKYVHLANSSAIFRHNSPATNLVRLGIMTYGVYTASREKQPVELKSVMTFKSALTQIKEIKKGEYVGYNRTWRAPVDGQYGIIPIGYADGYDFLLSNKGIVAVEGQICRVIGKVSMDMITIDLTGFPEAKIGMEVILLGGGFDRLRAEQLTAEYGGSAYELLCQIGRRAKRYYYAKGKLVSQAPLSRREFVSSDFSAVKLSSIINSAINQRLQDEELADLIYREVLRGFFYNKDKDIQYRRNFIHTIEFQENDAMPEFYLAKTRLQFTKELQSDYFLVVCANNDAELKRYFLRRDVEYRWLMDSNFDLTTEQFTVTNVKVGNLLLNTTPKLRQGCLEIHCSHSQLATLIGKDVTFQIETVTLYPKASHQLSIYITELTKGVEVRFIYPATIKQIETQTVFSGKNKYPKIIKTGNCITVKTSDNEWVFPNSGIVFAY